MMEEKKSTIKDRIESEGFGDFEIHKGMDPEYEEVFVEKGEVEKAEKDEIPGGKAEGKNIEDVMKKYSLSKEEAMKICEEGTKHELEHTSVENIAREIARDHIWEDKDYYKKLKKIED